MPTLPVLGGMFRQLSYAFRLHALGVLRTHTSHMGVLGRVTEHSYRTISIYFHRKWFVDRLMDISLVVLQPVYATLYVLPFLRCLGVKIGQGAEVSTAHGINFELTDIGEQSFVADRVIIGNAEVRKNMVTQKRTQLYKWAFLGFLLLRDG